MHRDGRLGDARRAYGELLSIEPANPDANNLMGLLLIQTGEPIRAVRHIRRALRTEPENAQSHFNLGVAYKDQKRMAEAVGALTEATRLEPGNMEFQASLGNALRLAGRPQEAVDVLERGLRRASGDEKLKLNLALAQNDLGTVRVQRGEQVQAMRHFFRAIELHPRHAQAHINLGLCLEQLGRLDDAERHYQAAIRARPQFADAHFQLAHLRTHRSSEHEIEAMQQLLDGPSTPEPGRVRLAFGLGFALESIGRYDEAFDAMTQAHRMQAQQQPFDLEAETARFERIREVFSLERLRDSQDHGIADTRPVFIVGMPRSGTSLAEQVLASHPDAHGRGELLAMSRAVQSLSNGKTYPEGLGAIDSASLQDTARHYLAELEAGAGGARRIIDTTPMNFLFVGLAALMLPEARFVFCRRNPLDNGLSLYRQLLTGANAFAHQLDDLGGYYRLHDALLSHWHNALPERAFELQYEALVRDTEAQVRKLLGFCDLPFDDRCIRFHETERVVRSPSAAQVRQPVYDSSIGAWRRYAKQLEPLRNALGRD